MSEIKTFQNGEIPGAEKTPPEVSHLPEVAQTGITPVSAEFDPSKYDDVLRSLGLVQENDGADAFRKVEGAPPESDEQMSEIAQDRPVISHLQKSIVYFENMAQSEWEQCHGTEDTAQKDKHYHTAVAYSAKAQECRAQLEQLLAGERLETTQVEPRPSGENTVETTQVEPRPADEERLETTQVEPVAASNFEKLPYDSLHCLPPLRRFGVVAHFREAPEGIQNIVRNFEKSLTVLNLERNPDGSFDACHYNPETRTIKMNPSYDNEEYTQVFSHEFGHYADHQLGDVSAQPPFMDALQKDADSLKGKLKKEMLHDLEHSDVLYDRNVSDILSGVFNNGEDIVAVYDRNGAPFYHHTNEYWSHGPDNALQKETFAELFAVYSDQSKAESAAFIEKYFPRTAEAFKAIIEQNN